MRRQRVEYLHLPPETTPAPLENLPRRMIVLVEADVSNDWQNDVSEWIIESGCLFMMAWGRDCSSWDDSVDWANLERFDFEPIPEEARVMTTWHEGDPLEDVFDFDVRCALHRTTEMLLVTIVHIADEPRRDDLLQQYQRIALREG